MNMVKAPEKFLDEYLSRKKVLGGKAGAKSSVMPVRKVSAEELARLKINIQTLWGVYGTPEIREILAKEQEIRFLKIESEKASLSLMYREKGIFMEYEVNLGYRKELAGAQMYKQADMNLNRYFTHATGTDDLLRSANEALYILADVFIDKEIPETDIWNAIANGEQVRFSFMSV
ncbi:MAG: hypothetical protein B6D35_03110 [Candidatus Brocadia sp. UTAMX2]|nr:MAG: hypothetical protein B6D35_03110 [Candidatus Brocadia sp. UTAMX2]